MKFTRVIMCFILVALATSAFGRKRDRDYESYGNTVNVGLSLAYYKFVGEAVPAVRINYEIDVAEDITVAPFVGYFGFHSFAFPDKNSPLYRHYYREIVMPMGATGYYYFDGLLGDHEAWDFYAGLSLGIQYRRKTWTDGYVGASTVAKNTADFYYDGHIGVEYHLSSKIGAYLDLSKGMTMFGIGVHL